MVEGHARFKALEDLSDSEAEMDLESEVDGSTANGGTIDDVATPAQKRSRTGARNRADGESVPKWSNPDPYTALPPPDESQAKKKDVVELIRKAKVVAVADASDATAIADNADFISFNFDDDLQHESSGEVSEVEELQAPTGPRQSNQNGSVFPPGYNASSVTSASLGPPPSYNTRHTPSFSSGPLAGTSSSTQTIHANASAGSQDVRSLRALGALPPAPAGPPRLDKKRKRAPLRGEVLWEWSALNAATATPWCTEDHSTTEHMGLR